MKQEVVPVDQQLKTILQQQIAKNRTIMAPWFKTVLFCGCNNIVFRGSRDKDPSNESLKGNFQALLYFRVESGVLQEHFETASRNATYVSKTIQNEMITTAGKYIKDQLSVEIRASKYFSLIADEATDVSNKENLSLVIRFVDSTQTIREEFVGIHLREEGTSARAIKNVITNAVADLGLNMKDCHGQCYDGAGNMAVRLNGASTLIKEDYNKAIYFHCMNHRLNLCIADTCSYHLVRDMMATVRKLSEFFNNSPKRQQHLVKNIKELLPNNNHEVPINVCRTRWVARIDGMDRIV
ncbi:52 kDa repressor of the inhibitor of the protein kinase-like [Acropora millepora]|uniref:52 kDa repressor of the inhibitor of the protein kinase-like n=1 Tax=Acropora millepora TaxID=45264 RepID=UPI001CF39AB5|nr:52 kDa repressor of the inhibitor of the protein kinase-like [Acropora millepora]